jgi:hypothetical protein
MDINFCFPWQLDLEQFKGNLISIIILGFPVFNLFVDEDTFCVSLLGFGIQVDI